MCCDEILLHTFSLPILLITTQCSAVFRPPDRAAGRMVRHQPRDVVQREAEKYLRFLKSKPKEYPEILRRNDLRKTYDDKFVPEQISLSREYKKVPFREILIYYRQTKKITELGDFYTFSGDIQVTSTYMYSFYGCVWCFNTNRIVHVHCR